MVDRPIIFSAPMVRALLDGRKSQTRRILKPQPEVLGGFVGFTGSVETATVKLPYAIGDRLYVREAHSLHDAFGQDRDDGMRWGPWPDLPSAICPDRKRIAYFREGFDRCGPPRWRPSIHMPRWASRLTLIVKDVRVQRLQFISGEDCIAEGAKCDTCAASWTVGCSACNQRGCFEIRQNFRTLWNSLHGPDAWDANPCVVAVSFTVHRQNIDQMEPAP